MLHSEKDSVYRFNHTPPEHLPLAVRSAGFYRLRPGSMIEPSFTKWFSEIFWCASGNGDFRLAGQTFTVKAGEVFYLLPGELHDLEPREAPWEYYWLTLDHKESARWLKSFGFVERPFAAGEVPRERFANLIDCLRQGSTSGDRQAAHHAHALLLAATERKYGAASFKPADWVVQCREIIDRDYTDPQLNVNELAHTLKVHRATLFRAFRQAYRMTPSVYLQNRRLHHAMELLKAGQLSVKEVARESGIPDANYFTKLLRRKSGFSPREFCANYRKGRLIQS